MSVVAGCVPQGLVPPPLAWVVVASVGRGVLAEGMKVGANRWLVGWQGVDVGPLCADTGLFISVPSETALNNDKARIAIAVRFRLN